MPQSSLDARTMTEQVRLLYVQSRQGLLANLGVGGVVVLVLAPSVATMRLVLWASALVALTLGRELLGRAYLRQVEPAPRTWKSRFTVATVAQGLVWGGGAVFLFPESERGRAFILIVLAGMTAGAVSFLAYVYSVYATYVFVTLAPLAFHLLVLDAGRDTSLALVMIVYGAAVLGAGRRVHGALLDAMRLRFQNADLADATRASERLLAMHVDRTPLAVIRWRPRFVVAEWNHAAERIFGHDRSQAVGAHASALLGAGVDYEAVWSRVVASVDGIAISSEHVARDGRRLVCDWYHTPLVEADGTVVGVASIAHDVTERRAAERMKDEFLATVSHELRTPLAAIQGAVDLMLGGVAGDLPETARELSETAAANARRLRKLVDDLLDSEKLESGSLSVFKRPVHLGPLVDQIVEGASPFARRYDVVIARAADVGGDAVVETDPDRLGQVLMNLLSNAAKFSHPKGRVEAWVEKSEAGAVLAVRDHGVGIPEEFRPRVFQRFSQLDSSDSRAKGGTGLGLAISKAIVDKLGGELSFESVVGAGTTFRITLR